MEKITYKLDAFEGPMDLLYHLIEKNEVDIYDIPIFEITEQYIEFIDKMQYKNMDSLSEFLLMAATLLEIKSKMLLPKPSLDEEEVDPREELVSRLIEYKRFKLIAQTLKAGELGTTRLYKPEDKKTTKLFKKKTEVNFDELLNNISLNNLFEIFEEVLKRQDLKIDKVRHSFNAVQKDLFTIDEKIEYLKNLIYLYDSINFFAIFDKDSSKNEKVVTFLALLELIKIKYIKITQNALFDDIYIEKYL